MNTLIIPCAGKSSRFPGMPPKWLLKYPDGSLMVKKAIEGLPLEKFDRIIITAVKEHLDAYNAEPMIIKAFDKEAENGFELCVLDEFTSSQAETVYKTIKQCNVSGSFAVKDSDNYIEMNVPENKDFVVGIDMHSFGKEIERLSAKSFLVVNSQGIITDIIEKKIVSEYISIGMYGFREAQLFCEAFEHIVDTKGMAKEIYLSHVISYLIGMKKSVYSYLEAKDYEDWGTQKDWYQVLKQKKTYFINVADIIQISENELSIEVENEEALKYLTNIGAQIILLGNMGDVELKKIKEYISAKGIKIHASVPDCYSSHQVILKQYSKEIPYPACEAINLKFGDTLKGVINNEG